jgi:hypothetical protein
MIRLVKERKMEIINDLEQPIDGSFGYELDRLAKEVLAYDLDKNEDWSGTDEFKGITEYINKMAGIPAIKLLEDILGHYKCIRNALRTIIIPDILKQAGLTETVTKSGISIKLDRDLTVESVAAMPEPKKDQLYKWIAKNGGKSLLKDILKLGKGEFNKALENFLQEGGYDYEKESGIHPMSLKKFLTDLKTDGKEIPENVIHTELFDVAKIKN